MFKSIIRSFRHAMNGLIFSLKTGRNLRIHFCALFFTTIFGLIYGLDKFGFALLFLISAVVITVEILNTAIESVVDMHTQHFSPYAKKAKDIAASAVLITALFAVFIAILLFSDVTKLQHVYTFFINTPLYILPLIVAISAAIYLIYGEKK